jgi:hypothetical protein
MWSFMTSFFHLMNVFKSMQIILISKDMPYFIYVLINKKVDGDLDFFHFLAIRIL